MRKAPLVAHPIEEIENLDCRVTEFMIRLRKAAQDPTMSTYMTKSKAMSDYTVAKQFLLETDEARVERIERLARAIEKTISEEVGNKLIMSSDASRHSVTNNNTINTNDTIMNNVNVSYWVQLGSEIYGNLEY